MPGGWQGTTRTAPLPSNWKRVRAEILDRDGHECQWPDGARVCGALATDVDHIGDPADHSHGNLRALCAPHHKARTSRQGNASRWSPKRTGRRPPEAHPGLIR